MKSALCFALIAFGAAAHGEVFLETGFEGSSSLPTGWTQELIDPSDVNWTIQTGGQGNNPATANSGTNNAILYDGNSADDKTRLISPAFDTTGFTTIRLTFWHTQTVWSPDQDELKILFRSDDGSSWTELAHYTQSVSLWTERVIDIPASSATSRIAFEGNAKWGHGVCLDDIRVVGFPESWPEVSVSATDATASEADTDIGKWTITRSGDTSAELTVDYTLSGSAEDVSDYTIDMPSPLTFGIGETSLVVTLTPVDDVVFEGLDPETAVLMLTQLDGYRIGVASDTITIAGNEPLISVTATDNDASEVGPEVGTWTITRSGNTSGALAVNYTLTGTATSGSDYTIDTPSPVNFAAGQTSKVVTLTPVDDTVAAEGDEVVTLTLTAGSGYAIEAASGDISIYDDEGFDLNILVIGSTHSFSEGGEHDVVHEKPFNPTAIATHLQQILTQDPLLSDTVNVAFEDVFKTKTNEVRTSGTGINNITAHCYSLAQHFMWPDGKTARLANLRSEDGTKWDYVVLCADPYIMANFPGMFAEGVKLIQSEVAKTVVPEGENPPEVVLMAQWPENSSTFSADDFNEVVHRVGNSAGLPVVPAGKVWDALDTNQDSSSSHPTPKGEYLAAATIYSKLYERSASTSGYTFAAGGDAMADLALTEVQAIASTPQYSGIYTDINPFQMKYVSKRDVNFRETGTSTEDRLALALHRLDDVCRIRFIQNQGTFWDFNYGRGNDWWEDDKDYEVNPAKHDRAYGFPIHHYYTGSAANAAAQTMPYGIDKYYYGSGYEDGTDLGIAYNMIRPNTRELSLPEDVRAIPIRLLWLKMVQARPGFQPLGDNTHMSPYLNDASAAFMYTLLSGRCPVVEEPATVGSAAWLQWLGHKTGYETAWQMSHLTTRAPGFRVLPSDVSTTAVTRQAGETMTVRFTNPPQSNVTVTVSTSNTGAASVSPSTLVFTPENYDTPQEVMVSGKTITPASEDFEVLFATSSDDEVYDSLGDSWSYTTLNTNTATDLIAGFDGNNTSTISGSTKTLSDPHQSTAVLAMGVDATLSTTDTMAKEFQWTAANQASLGTWGTLVLPPPPITYNNTTVATIAAPTTLNFTIDNTAGTQAIELKTFHFSAQRDSGAALQVTIAYAGGDLAGSSGIQSLVNDTGTNHGYDFDLTAILSNNVLAAGETATFTIAQTTSETARLKIDDIAISGIVMGGTFTDWISGYEVGAATAFSDDPDKDGLGNGIENFFGTHPGEFSSGLVAATLTGSTFTFSHPLNASPADDISAAYRWSKDLATFHADGASHNGTTVSFSQGTPAGGVVDVTATITGTPLDRVFVDISVGQQ